MPSTVRASPERRRREEQDEKASVNQVFKKQKWQKFDGFGRDHDN
jgi:hypothetical protein